MPGQGSNGLVYTTSQVYSYSDIACQHPPDKRPDRSAHLVPARQWPAASEGGGGIWAFVYRPHALWESQAPIKLSGT